MAKLNMCLALFVQAFPGIEIDEEDLVKYALCKANFDKDGYITVFMEGKKYHLHRLVMGMPNEEVDHKNGRVKDNRKENLRLATRGQNAANRGVGINNTSGYKGVTETKNGKWLSYIRVNGERRYLGTYKTKEDAAKIYNLEALKAFGEFARLNVIEQEI